MSYCSTAVETWFKRVGGRVEVSVITALEFDIEKRGIANMALLIDRVDSGEEGVVLSHGELSRLNLPPPNNDPNVPEDEHAPAPKHAPIAPNLELIQLNDYLADNEEPKDKEEPIPKQALVAPARFAP
ncbi:hypothetical protein Tco_1113914 [Tanacetum coccineum]|uniref:Uncharacterized protein n=1 Tax=Tanacetum coccineum TaxID=301880 RepID=A0ABQ5IUP5_9ASTR